MNQPTRAESPALVDEDDRVHDPAMAENLRPPSMEDVSDTASQFAAPTQKRRRPPRAGMIGFFVVGLVLLILSVVGAFVGPMIFDMFEQDRLIEEGLPAPAEILSVRETNGRVNHRWVYELTLEVSPEGMQPYTTQVSQPFSELHAANLRAGGSAQVHYDKDDPKKVVVMSTGGPLVLPKVETKKELSQLCTQANACCVKVTDPEKLDSCMTLLNPAVPDQACQAALDGYQLAAKAKGVSCE